MTPTNTQELKELAELRSYVKELEEAVLRCAVTFDSCGDKFCQMCHAIKHRYIVHHNPDCLITTIRNRRGL